MKREEGRGGQIDDTQEKLSSKSPSLLGQNITPYSANKLEQIGIIKVANDSRKFFHLNLSQWFH